MLPVRDYLKQGRASALKDAPILLLDEPTSAVDGDTEAEIMEAIDALSQDRTTLMISHRPSTLAGCDRLLSVENGLITARSQVPRSHNGVVRLGTNDWPATGANAVVTPTLLQAGLAP